MVLWHSYILCSLQTQSIDCGVGFIYAKDHSDIKNPQINFEISDHNYT